MKNKMQLIFKIVLLTFLSLLWFVLIQAVYEMMTKPYLQNDFPIIKGALAVYFLGIILLIISILIFALLIPAFRKLRLIYIDSKKIINTEKK